MIIIHIHYWHIFYKSAIDFSLYCCVNSRSRHLACAIQYFKGSPKHLYHLGDQQTLKLFFITHTTVMGGYGRRHRGGRFGMSYASQHQMMAGTDEDGGAYEMEEHSEECKLYLSHP